MTLEITSVSAAQWSRLGPRAVYGQALLDLAQSNLDVLAMSADLGNSSGLDRFRKTYPKRFINAGIAEQNLVGVAAGLAMSGFVPFVSSFAPFITMRAAEQVRMNLGYMNLNVKAVGIGSGLSMGFLGNSHFGLEDIGVMRLIPGIAIFSPADCGELVKVVECAAKWDGPCYIRLTGEPGQPAVYHEEYVFEPGKIHQLRQGDSIALLATGSMVAQSLSAADALARDSIDVAVFNVHTLRPLDQHGLDAIGRAFSIIFTVEEHSLIGGLGSAVSEHFSSRKVQPLVCKVGLPHEFGPTGKYGYLLSRHGLDAIGIRNTVLQQISILENGL
jgi:transketolase